MCITSLELSNDFLVFNAYIFECCNDSNYIDIYMYITHIYIVFFFIQSMDHTVTHLGHGYWHQITLSFGNPRRRAYHILSQSYRRALRELLDID